MAFCTFDENAALFDSTPVENMFITEYMLRAPGDFVKVYIYALMLCYHNAERMSLASMAKDLDMTEEEVERAFRYWARDGLCRQVGDNPVCYKLYNLKQLTLTRAQSPGDQVYHQDFAVVKCCAPIVLALDNSTFDQKWEAIRIIRAFTHEDNRLHDADRFGFSISLKSWEERLSRMTQEGTNGRVW